MTVHPSGLDSMFCGSVPLYDHRGVYLDMSRLPMLPEKLLELISFLKALRMNTLVVYWGELFPWKFEDRIQSPFAYPEQVISGFYRLLEKEDIRAYTMVPGPEKMSFVLGLKAFRYLRRDGAQTDCLATESPGARQVILEIIEDILHITGSAGLFLESDGIPEVPGTGSGKNEGSDSCEKEIGYFRWLIETTGTAGGEVLFQLPRGCKKGLKKLFSENSVSAVFPLGNEGEMGGSRSDWVLVSLDEQALAGINGCRGVLLIPPPADGTDELPVPVSPENLWSLAAGAGWAWNGHPVEVNKDLEVRVESLCPWSCRDNESCLRFRRALDEVYRLSREVKERAAFLLSYADYRDMGDRDTISLLCRAEEALKEVRKGVTEDPAAGMPFVNPEWIEQRRKVKSLPAFEELSSSVARLQFLLEVSGLSNGMSDTQKS